LKTEATRFSETLATGNVNPM